MGGKRGIVVLLIGVFLMGVVFFYKEPVLAAQKVSDCKALKQALEMPGKETIILAADISVPTALHAKGEKILDGNGHEIRRGQGKNTVYGGTLLVAEGNSLRIQNAVLSGSAGKKEKDYIYGRLAEVRHGRLILGQRSVLQNNRNESQAADGGGAVLVQKNGICILEGGEISGNRTVTGGAGIRIEAGGEFVIKGGAIRDNVSQGLGAVEDFDGRGGAIYNAGRIVIYGGRIEGNQAKKYSDGKMDYGGVGGMLYNRGECYITGGTIEKNTASFGGGAIYTDSGSRLQIAGGKFLGNQAGRGAEVYFAGGSCHLAGRPEIASLYVEKNRIVTVARNFTGKRTILLIPGHYREDVCLVKTSKKGMLKRFTLEKKSGFYLRRKKDGLYLRQEKYQIIYRTDGGKGVMEPTDFLPDKKISLAKNCFWREGYEFAGWSHKKQESTNVEYHDGQKVQMGKRTVVLYAVWRPKQENTQAHEKQRKKKERKLFAGEFAQKEKGVSKKYKIKIISNHRPVIRVAPRYFFSWEVQNNTETKWRETLFQGCQIKDDWDKTEDLQKVAEFDWNGLLDNQPGTYHVHLRIRDQYGHRFYMKSGQKKRYGTGKVTWADITVTVVGGNKQEKTTEGAVRFLQVSNFEDGDLESEEIWCFGPEDIQKIKQYMGEREDPFSGETNRIFLERFSYCNSKREKVWETNE
ncbi:MAG: InlB B-repeat-containing protein [Lachnospiraceae bacterium]|nr:InlB B-repeat-containing protein [Lachnospiraceae bacterium]